MQVDSLAAFPNTWECPETRYVKLELVMWVWMILLSGCMHCLAWQSHSARMIQNQLVCPAMGWAHTIWHEICYASQTGPSADRVSELLDGCPCVIVRFRPPFFRIASHLLVDLHYLYPLAFVWVQQKGYPLSWTCQCPECVSSPYRNVHHTFSLCNFASL